MSTNVWYSNQVEILYEKLKESLFVNSKAFTRRMVIVPSPAMKSWLMLRMADDPDLGIAAGLEVSYLDQSILQLQHLGKSKDQEFPNIPGCLELALQIESEIRELLRDPASDIWKPLFDYLKVKDHRLSRKSESRVISLSEKLASLFLLYRMNGRRMMADWKGKNWQEQLYFRVLGEIPWAEDIVEFTQFASKDIQVHLFAKSFIPRCHFDFFQKLSEWTEVHFYLISPCEAFWSDILSDRESYRLQSHLEEKGVSENQLQDLEEYLSDRNPLLANFGRLGREMAQQVESSNSQVEEQYDDSEPSSLLQLIQSEILHLENPVEPTLFSQGDSSVQVHMASSKRREVEILYQNLMSAIDEDPELSPNEMIVMAPDIVEYAPYIQAVFGSEESQLDFQIMDMNLFSQNRLAQGFLHLLDLPLSRWDVTSLLELFENPAFQKKHFSSEEDLFRIRQWMKDTGIRWGFDLEHRNALVKRSHCENKMVESSQSGTWQNGMNRLLMGLAMRAGEDITEKKPLSILPYEGIQATQGELLGKWIYLLQSLQEDLRPLINGSKKTLNEWGRYLKCLCEAYFTYSLDEGEQLFDHIDSLRQPLPLGESVFSFQSIKGHLEAALARKQVNYRESHLHAVRFCSMLPMRAIPAKVIALLGMSDGAYPRQEPKLSLNLMAGHPKTDYTPSQTDFDRYLFLEALLSTRKKLLISYLGYSQSDGKEQPPSLIIQELLGYLDKSARVEGMKPSDVCVVKHPFRSYDEKYFSKDSSIVSYIPSHFRAAKAYYIHDQKPGHCFIKDFSIHESSEVTEGLIFDLKDLTAIARNPVEAYFTRTLGMYLKPQGFEDPEQQDFLISALDAAILRKSSLKNPIEEVLQVADKEGILPIGKFKALAIEKMIEDAKVLEHNLRQMGVQRDEIFEIEFSELHDKPVQNKNGDWQLPPLEFTYQDRAKIKIIGKFSDVTDQGLLSLYSGDKKDILRLWPSVMVLSALRERYSLPIADQLLFAKSGKTKSVGVGDSELLLRQYLDYTRTCMLSVSPLIPEWIPDLISLDSNEFEKKMQSSVSERSRHFYNHHIRWILSDSRFPDTQTLFDHWKPVAIDLFSPLLKVWK